VPVRVLRTAARLLGKADFAERLCGSLQVDISKTRELLGWAPPVSVDEALKQTAQHFLANL
jgi:nucleoside-diphosphate-sugar epimerase